jgi:hypothetical protein
MRGLDGKAEFASSLELGVRRVLGEYGLSEVIDDLSVG